MRWITPPVLLVICGAVMGALHGFVPLFAFANDFWRWTGIAVLWLGLMITAAGRVQFRKERAPIWTFNDPPRLMTDGIFRLTRNPMYLGLSVVLLGWALILGSLAPFAGWLVFVGACNRVYIPIEEERLAALFGEDYAAYRSTTRRWL